MRATILLALALVATGCSTAAERPSAARYAKSAGKAQPDRWIVALGPERFAHPKYIVITGPGPRQAEHPRDDSPARDAAPALHGPAFSEAQFAGDCAALRQRLGSRGNSPASFLTEGGLRVARSGWQAMPLEARYRIIWDRAFSEACRKGKPLTVTVWLMDQDSQSLGRYRVYTQLTCDGRLGNAGFDYPWRRC